MIDFDTNNPATRWICYHCGDLTWLDDDGLCRACQPERVAVEFYQVCMRVLVGEAAESWRVWRIG